MKDLLLSVDVVVETLNLEISRYLRDLASRFWSTPNGKPQAAVCPQNGETCVSRAHFSLFRVCSLAVADWVEISLN